MKGKDAIMQYLETHQTFTAKAVADEYGLSVNCITKNALSLVESRKIVRLDKVWRTVTYPWRHRKSRMVPRAAALTEYFRSVGKARR